MVKIEYRPSRMPSIIVQRSFRLSLFEDNKQRMDISTLTCARRSPECPVLSTLSRSSRPSCDATSSKSIHSSQIGVLGFTISICEGGSSLCHSDRERTSPHALVRLHLRVTQARVTRCSKLPTPLAMDQRGRFRPFIIIFYVERR